jgi:hypothetical protein
MIGWIVRMSFAFAVLCIAGTALAEEPGACKADREKFCKDVKPGKGRIVACLKGRAADLAPACRDALAKGKEKARQFKEACKGDVEKFCKGVKPGEGRILACLKGSEANLSAECKAEVGRSREKHEAYKAACGADQEKYCKAVKPGQGRILACLKGREADLSAGCKEFLGKGKPAEDTE